MIAVTPAPIRRTPAPAAPPRLIRRHEMAPNPLAIAILHELRQRSSHPNVTYLAVQGDLDEVVQHRSRQADLHVIGAHLPGAEHHDRCPVLVYGWTPRSQGPVLLALDDDTNPEPLVRFAAAEAARRGRPLRAVHVSTESGTEQQHSRSDRMCDADRLLDTALHAHLPEAAVRRTERQILHDREPARALIDLSTTASLLVIGSRSRAGEDDLLGDTVANLIGRTHCPVAVLPRCEDAGWR